MSRLTVRKIENISFKDHEKDCFHDLYMNYFHLVFYVFVPKGEKYFIDTIAQVIRYLDPEFKAEARDFILQESNHMILHDKFNKAFFKHYPLLSKIIKFQNTVMPIATYLPLKINLATVVATEHFTALWSRWVLQNRIGDKAVNDDFGRFLKWHSLEEIEHISFVEECLEALECSYFHRLLGVFAAIFSVILPGLLMVFFMTTKDKRLYSKSGLNSFRQFLFAKNGISRSILIPFFLYIFPFLDHKIEISRILFQEIDESLKSHYTIIASVKS